MSASLLVTRTIGCRGKRAFSDVSCRNTGVLGSHSTATIEQAAVGMARSNWSQRSVETTVLPASAALMRARERPSALQRAIIVLRNYDVAARVGPLSVGYA